MPKRTTSRGLAPTTPPIESLLDPIGQRLLYLYLTECQLAAELDEASDAGVCGKSVASPTDRAVELLNEIGVHILRESGSTLVELGEIGDRD